MNDASFALGNFTNLNGWPAGYAFILSFLAPLWTICKFLPDTRGEEVLIVLDAYLGSFDSSVHISEEAANAATAVPWAIVGAISVAGILGWGT